MKFITKILFSFILLISVRFLINSQSLNDFHKYEINLRADRISFFDLIEHVEIVRLEETNNSLLPRIEWSFELPDGIAVIDKKSNQVHIFDKKGNYKNSIKRFGRGPEEYSDISSAWLKDNRIELFSNSSRSLQRYGLDGIYIETVAVKYSKDIQAGAMIPYKDGYLFESLDASVNEKADYALVFLNNKLEINSMTAQVVKPHPFPVNFGKRFRYLNNRILYKKNLSDSLFTIENYRTKPFMKFDFGDSWVWNDPINLSSTAAASKVFLQNTDKVFEILPDIGNENILLTYFYKISKFEMGIIRKEDGKFSRIDLRKKDKENYEINFLQWHEDRLVCSIQAYDFEEFLSNLKTDQFTISGGLNPKDFLDAENPFLLRIKFK